MRTPVCRSTSVRRHRRYAEIKFIPHFLCVLCGKNPPSTCFDNSNFTFHPLFRNRSSSFPYFRSNHFTMKTNIVVGLITLGTFAARAQEKPLEMKMDFEEYDPPSTLVTPEHILTRAKYPFIDVHNHQWNMPTQDLNQLLAEMDKLNMKVMVHLSGRGRGSTEFLEKSLENVKNTNPKRFIIFTNMDFAAIDDPQWQSRMLKQLEDDVKKG